MVYEIATTFDDTDPDAPTIQFDGTGPSLTITLNQWPNKFAVCVVYRDTNTPSKSYGCSPFFVEPDGNSDASFCTTWPLSCYCDSSCVSDFTHFCDYYNWIPGTESDLTIIIDTNNSVSPREYQLNSWQYTQPTESADCPETFENSVRKMKLLSGVWEDNPGNNFTFDPA